MKLITDMFTERDGTSWCFVRIAAVAPLAVMTYKFFTVATPDYANYAGGLAAIFASIGFKNFSEKP